MIGYGPTKIHIVDDDPMFLQLLQMHLAKNKGYVVKSFENGEDALADIQDKPHIMILDYYLDGQKHKAMNGLEILRRVKVIDQNIIVIMLSSATQPTIKDGMQEFGGYYFLSKDETAFHKLDEILQSVIEE